MGIQWSHISINGTYTVAGPGGLGPPPHPLKLVKKQLPHHTASFASHWAPLGQISGSATDISESYLFGMLLVVRQTKLPLRLIDRTDHSGL